MKTKYDKYDIDLLAEINSVSRIHTLNRDTIDTIMIEFSKRILESLKISRLSAWLLDKQEISIESIGEYELDNGHFNKGSKILKNEAPEYFDAILDNQLLIFDDVYSDPKTKGLIGYCKHHNIVSMMDIPMRIEGEFIGVICFEIKDKEKTITENDKIFALSTAQVLASTLESRFRRSLQYHIDNDLKTLIDKLKRSEEMYKLIVDTTEEMILHLNEDGLILWKNEAFTGKFGQSVANISDIIEDMSLHNQHVTISELNQHIRDNGSVSHLYVNMRRSDGEITNAIAKMSLHSSDNDNNYFILFLSDISTIKSYERHLEDLNKRFNYATSASNDIIFELDLVNNIVWWNESILKYTHNQYVSNEWIDIEHFYHFIDPEPSNDFKTLLIQKIESVENIWNHYIKHTDQRSGEIYYFKLNCLFQRDFHGTVLKISGSMSDITNIIKSREKLEKILFTVAHRITRPLVNLSGLSDLIENYTLSETELKTIIGYIKKSVNQIQKINKEISVSISDQIHNDMNYKLGK